ncbi:HIRAN domain-containing protein [Paenibacillus sp. GCM10027626]|uniref:HIRAN domain-containing protein n=1 Tax=Paenibacillus sp. GCM10027626 TaxID=3273411 RepID=UPI003643BE9E
MEQSVFVAITGTQHYYGTTFLKQGQLIILVKDPDNPHDQEAIEAEIAPIGKIGYVANSAHTVPKGCRSTGRIYDTFEQHISGFVRFVVKDTAIVEFVPNLEEVHIIKTLGDAAFSSYR